MQVASARPWWVACRPVPPGAPAPAPPTWWQVVQAVYGAVKACGIAGWALGAALIAIGMRSASAKPRITIMASLRWSIPGVSFPWLPSQMSWLSTLRIEGVNFPLPAASGRLAASGSQTDNIFSGSMVCPPPPFLLRPKPANVAVDAPFVLFYDKGHSLV